jgi:tetratricopeptide (TPR) repeat protein/O-antigen ligase
MKQLLNKIFNPPLDILVFKIYIYWFILGISIFIFFSNYLSSLFSVLVLLIFSSGFFILRYLRGDIRSPFKIAYLFPIFMIFAIISIFFSVDKYSSILSIITYISLFIIFMLSFDILSEPKVLKWFLSWLLFIGVIFSIVGIIYYVGGYSHYLVGTLNSSFISAAFLLLLIPVSFYFYIFSNKVSSRVINLFTLSILIVSLFITYSYFSYIALFVEIVLILFILRNYWVKDIVKIFFLIVVSIVLFVAVSKYNKPFDKIYNTSSNITDVLNISSSQRIRLYEKEWNIFIAKPFFGYGIGTNSDVFKKFEYSPWLYLSGGYNVFINLFLDVGVFGGLAFLGFFGIILYYGFYSIFSNPKYLKLKNNPPKNFIFIPIFVSIFGVILYSFFNNDLSYISILLPLFIFVGIVFNYFNLDKKFFKTFANIVFVFSIVFIVISIDLYLSGVFFNNGIKVIDGSLSLNKSQVNSALNYFDNSALLFPFNFNTYNEIGISFEYLKEYNKSIDNFKKSLSINSYNPNANYQLGRAYYNNNEYKKSLVYFKKAYNFNKLYNPLYLLSLGEYYSFRKQNSKSEKIYKEAIKLFPLKNLIHEDYPQIFYNNNDNSNLSNIYTNLYSMTKNIKYYNLYEELSPLHIQTKIPIKKSVPKKK